MAKGYVYILVNNSMPGLVKIGLTERAPETRARELSRATGVPTPFVIVHFVMVPNCYEAERSIHLRLKKYREQQNREFFRLPVSDAIDALNELPRLDVMSSIDLRFGLNARVAFVSLGAIILGVALVLLWFNVVIPVTTTIVSWGGKPWVILAAILIGSTVIWWGVIAIRTQQDKNLNQDEEE